MSTRTRAVILYNLYDKSNNKQGSNILYKMLLPCL